MYAHAAHVADILHMYPNICMYIYISICLYVGLVWLSLVYFPHACPYHAIPRLPNTFHKNDDLVDLHTSVGKSSSARFRSRFARIPAETFSRCKASVTDLRSYFDDQLDETGQVSTPLEIFSAVSCFHYWPAAKSKKRILQKVWSSSQNCTPILHRGDCFCHCFSNESDPKKRRTQLAGFSWVSFEAFLIFWTPWRCSTFCKEHA